MTTTCKNCNQHFKGKFCNHCGQSSDIHDINFHFLWHDIQHGLLHFDKGIFYTIKQLFTRPGYTIREFIEGQRVKHFKPISLVLVLAGIYGLLMHYFDIPSIIQISANTEEQKVVDIKKITEWISSHYAFTTLLLLPITSLGTYWAFKKEKYNFVQHLVINAFLSGLHIILRIVFLPLLFLFDKESSMTILTIPDLIGAGFSIWALYQFFDYIPQKTRFLKILLSYFYVGLISIFFVFLISVMFGVLIAKMKHG
jgi:hypothetical protein